MVGIDGLCGHNGVDNAKGGGLFSFEQRIFDAVGFKLTGEVSVQSGVGLGVWKIYGANEAIQEVGCRNRPQT